MDVPLHNGVSNAGDDEITPENHARFVACLERHGGGATGREWSNMANELGWTVQQVQRYAYRYLVALCHEENDDTDENSNEIMVESGDDTPDAWSMEESVLFDTLLAVHLPKAVDAVDNSEPTWEERVAALIPNKSPLQVRERYEELYARRVNS